MRNFCAVVCGLMFATVSVAMGARGVGYLTGDLFDWNDARPGDSIKVEHRTVRDGKEVSSEQETTKVVSVDHDKVVLEATVTRKDQDGKPQEKTYKREVKLGKFGLPGGSQPASVKEGDEELTIGDKKVKCHWTETTWTKVATKRVVKEWTCDEVPGGVAKWERTVETTKDGITSKVMESSVITEMHMGKSDK